MEDLVVIDYGSGNLRSVTKACQHLAKHTDSTALRVTVTDQAEKVRKASRIILPGVGAFAACWQGLQSLQGMVEALQEAVLQKGRPFLGICVGMQLLVKQSQEHGLHQGLGWMEGTVTPLEPTHGRKIPHMGWNNITVNNPHPVLAQLDGQDMYFVHSYGVEKATQETISAVVHYEEPITAAIARDNILGVQFHPEKSQGKGLQLLHNFLQWTP